MKWQLVLVATLAAFAIRIDVLGATIDVPSPGINTIQDAVDAASNGDEIVVAPGIWAGFSSLLGFESLTIRSQDPQDPDIVLATVVASGSFIEGPLGIGNLLRIEGLSFRTGVIFVLESFVAFENCSFTASGVDCNQVGLTATNCVFTNCSLPSPVVGGGAISLFPSGDAFLVLTDCAFYSNSTAGSGGAVWVTGVPVSVEGCVFSGNMAGGSGGAISVGDGPLVNIRYCTFNGNGASSGGAITAFADEILLEGCVITGNRSGGDGGGASLAAGIGELRKCVVQANTAAGAGGGIAIAASSNPFTATGGITTVCANLPDQISGALSGMLRLGENCPPPGFVECLGDLDDDGMVGFTDLTILLANWGPCC